MTNDAGSACVGETADESRSRDMISPFPPWPRCKDGAGCVWYATLRLAGDGPDRYHRQGLQADRHRHEPAEVDVVEIAQQQAAGERSDAPDAVEGAEGRGATSGADDLRQHGFEQALLDGDAETPQDDAGHNRGGRVR